MARSVQAALACALLGLAVTRSAGGADAPAPTTAVASPPTRALLLRDRGPDCDPMEARQGRCTEEVDLLDLRAPLADAIRKELSVAFVGLQESLASRWDEDLAELLFGAAEGSLPPPETLLTCQGEGRRCASSPAESLRLDRAFWIGPEAPFRELRTITPVAQVPPPPVVLLRGRFSERLAYAGRLHDYDIMDGDSDSSGPFFEQFYPVVAGRVGRGIGLSAWHWSSEAIASALARSDWTALREEHWEGVLFQGGPAGLDTLAGRAFGRFFDAVGARILSNGLERTVPTHTRVLAALVAMRSPPQQASELRRVADVVAAASGQTDRTELVEERMGGEDTLRSVDFVLRYDQLPDELVSSWLPRFTAWREPTPAFLGRLTALWHASLSEHLHAEVSELQGTSEAARLAWVRANAMPGRGQDLALPMRRLALATLVADTPRADRDVVESRILLDHLAGAIAATFDPAPDATSTPAAVEQAAQDQWSTTLRQHGLSPQVVPEGLGAVNPLAICTTLNRRDALDEAVFRAVTVDLVIDGPAGLTRPEELLWGERARLPFVALDDPRVGEPELTTLIGLPAGRALYRARWRVWSGWHLLWNSAPAGIGDEHELRALLRTAAFCDDMVFAPPEIVPTLLRAALLAGDAFPTAPPRGRDRAAQPEPVENEAAVAAAQEQGDKAPEEAERIGDLGGEAAERADVAVDVAARGLERMGSAAEREAEGAALASLDPNLIWLREVVTAPLLTLAARAGLLLTVLDLDEGTARGMDIPPRTPYARWEGPRGAQVAAWSWWLPSDGKSPSLVAPGYTARPSVEAGAAHPRWARPQVWEGTITGDLGAIPLRDVRWRCDEDAPGVASGDTVPGCAESLGDAQSEGIAAESSALATFWLLPPRLALEAGPTVRLDLRPAGVAWHDDTGPSYNLTFRPQAGLSVGARFAPRPMPLLVRSTRSWGVQRPSGAVRRERWQLGARGGLTVGPGFGSLEGNLSADLWGAGSIYRARAQDAALLPYRPDLLLGPFARYQYGFAFGEAEPRYLMLEQSHTVVVGLRVHVAVGR